MLKIVDIFPMTGGKTWRDRLAEAIKRSGKSYRSISLKAGCGPTYVFDMMSAGNDPTIDRLMKVIEQVGGSSIYIIHGVEITAEEQAIIKEYSRLNRKDRELFLEMAKAFHPRKR
jgi:hypothetical protein